MMPTRLNTGLAPAWLEVACAQHAGLNAASNRKYIATRNMGVSPSFLVRMSPSSFFLARDNARRSIHFYTHKMPAATKSRGQCVVSKDLF
jgi:hypothetical protein